MHGKQVEEGPDFQSKRVQILKLKSSIQIVNTSHRLPSTIVFYETTTSSSMTCRELAGVYVEEREDQQQQQQQQQQHYVYIKRLARLLVKIVP